MHATTLVYLKPLFFSCSQFYLCAHFNQDKAVVRYNQQSCFCTVRSIVVCTSKRFLQVHSKPTCTLTMLLKICSQQIAVCTWLRLILTSIGEFSWYKFNARIKETHFDIFPQILPHFHNNSGNCNYVGLLGHIVETLLCKSDINNVWHSLYRNELLRRGREEMPGKGDMRECKMIPCFPPLAKVQMADVGTSVSYFLILFIGYRCISFLF